MDASAVVSSISAALSLVAIVVAFLVARQQLGQARRQALLPVMTDVLAEFRTHEFRDAMRFVRDAPGDVVLLEDPRAKQVMRYFNGIGALVRSGALDAAFVASFMGASVEDAWRRLGPYVYAERERREGDALYYGYFEHLAAEVARLGTAELQRRLRLERLPPAGRRPGGRPSP